MKRLLAFLLLSVSAFATTTVTGKIQNLGTANVTPNSFVRFWLRGCGGNQPRINGTSVIAPSQGGVFYFDIPADASGNISGTIYSTRDSTGLLAGDIECGGSKTAVWYGMQIWNSGKSGPEVPVHAKNTATLDITQVTPITTNPVVTSPTGDTTYARLDGGNQPFLGNISPSGNGTLSIGTNTNRWKFFGTTLDLSGAATLSGGGTLTGTFTGGTFSGSTISGPTLSGTIAGSPTFSGTLTLNRIVTNVGVPPGCTLTGAGSTASCGALTNSSDSFGQISLLANGSGITAAGTATITFNNSFATGFAVCVFSLDDAATAWNARATVKQLTHGTSTPPTASIALAWDNNSVSLGSGQSYNINYFCHGQ